MYVYRIFVYVVVYIPFCIHLLGLVCVYVCRPFAPPGWISADKSSVSTVGGAPGAGKATRSISLDVQV